MSSSSPAPASWRFCPFFLPLTACRTLYACNLLTGKHGRVLETVYLSQSLLSISPGRVDPARAVFAPAVTGLLLSRRRAAWRCRCRRRGRSGSRSLHNEQGLVEGRSFFQLVLRRLHRQLHSVILILDDGNLIKRQGDI